MAETIDWPPARPRPRRGRLLLLVVLAAIVLGGGTTLSYYVEALWFESLGYFDVFWKTLNLQAAIFTFFPVVTFLALYGAFLAFKPARLGELASTPILINGQPLKLPVEPVLRLIALVAVARHCRDHRRRHDGRVVDARPLLVRASRSLYGRPHFRPLGDLLFLHPAGLAAPHWLAVDARRHGWRDRSRLYRDHRRWHGSSSAATRSARPVPGAGCRSVSRWCC